MHRSYPFGMEPEVAAALIAAGVAIATALIALYQQRVLLVEQRSLAKEQDRSTRDLERLRAQLLSQREQEQRERDANESLDLHREPLLDASRDLLHRIINIRENGFLGYLGAPDPHRRQVAALGTLYRMAKYWATVDALYGTVNLLQFQKHEGTKDVADLLNRIGTIFASDSDKYGGANLMVWREEQRAIAELMRRERGTGGGVIGFATFVDEYQRDFEQWFSPLEKQLPSAGVEGELRLVNLQDALAALVQLLEAGRPKLQDHRR